MPRDRKLLQLSAHRCMFSTLLLSLPVLLSPQVLPTGPCQVLHPLFFLGPPWGVGKQGASPSPSPSSQSLTNLVLVGVSSWGIFA